MKSLAFKIVILFFLFIVQYSCKKNDEELVADFTVNYRKINVGEKVKFFDKSRNEPISWNWIFNGGTPLISEEQNPEVIYLNPGLYSVSLTVSNSTGNNSLVKSEYVEVVEFACGNDVIDNRDFNLYNTIIIGNYCWFKQNLNTGAFISTPSLSTDNDIIEKYCYNNDDANCNTYGGLYQWDEMMQYVTTEGAQGICPAGWHIPTDAEWTTLVSNYSSATAGTALKEGGTSGFEAKLGGRRDTDGGCWQITEGGYFWSTTVNGTNPWYRFVSNATSDVNRMSIPKTYGFSVRCLKN